MLGHFDKSGRFVPDFRASTRAYGAFGEDDDDDDRESPRRRQIQPNRSARRASVAFADVVDGSATQRRSAEARSGGATQNAVATRKSATGSETPPLLIRALTALKNPQSIPRWARIGAVALGGVAVVGTLAYFEEKHYAKLRSGEDEGEGEKGGEKSGWPRPSPKWKRVGS